MLTTRTSPAILIVLEVITAAGHAWHDLGDWLSAAVLTYCVTW